MTAKPSKLSSGLIIFSFRFTILMNDAGEVYEHYRFQLDYRDAAMTDCRIERILRNDIYLETFSKHGVLYLRHKSNRNE